MRRWRQLTAPIVAAGVPRAVIMGNHDDEADLMREQIVRLDIQLKVLHSPSLHVWTSCRLLASSAGCPACRGHSWLPK
jgi:hypothetical protein